MSLLDVLVKKWILRQHRVSYTRIQISDLTRSILHYPLHTKPENIQKANFDYRWKQGITLFGVASYLNQWRCTMHTWRIFGHLWLSFVWFLIKCFYLQIQPRKPVFIWILLGFWTDKQTPLSIFFLKKTFGEDRHRRRWKRIWCRFDC